MKIVLIIAVIVLCVLFGGYPFMWIWNYAVVKALTIAKPIEYWPAFWLAMFFAAFVRGNMFSGKDKKK